MTQHNNTKKLVVGISGASGAIYGIRLLMQLQAMKEIETHLVITRAASMTIAYETTYKLQEVIALANYYHPVEDISASIASGSYKTMGMIIAPCSTKTMAEIANGVTANLIGRAADVTLKERRRLVMMVRETPLHLGHIQNMETLSRMGAIIAPPVPAFYTKPVSLDEMVDYTIVRILDLFDIETNCLRRWQGMKK